MYFDSMERREAELLYESSKEAVVEKLLEMAACFLSFEQRIRELEKRNISLSSISTNSSKPPSTDGPQVNRPKMENSLRSPEDRRAIREAREHCLLWRRWTMSVISTLKYAASAVRRLTPAQPKSPAILTGIIISRSQRSHLSSPNTACMCCSAHAASRPEPPFPLKRLDPASDQVSMQRQPTSPLSKGRK
jgi:hypothetical protein